MSALEEQIDPLETSHTAPKFAAPNPDELANWYSNCLGFRKAVFDDGAYAIVARGELCLHFWKCEDRRIAENTACYTELESVVLLDMLHEEFAAAAQSDSFAPGRLEEAPKNQSDHNMREFHLWDPAGHLIGFGAPLD